MLFSMQKKSSVADYQYFQIGGMQMKNIDMIQSKEAQQDVQSKKINMKMDRAHNAMPQERTKDFKSSKDGDPSQKDNRLAEMMCKLFLQQSAANVDIEVFNCSPLEFSYFISIFEELLESKVFEPRDRLADSHLSIFIIRVTPHNY